MYSPHSSQTHTMPPAKKKVKGMLANLWQPSTSSTASNPPPSTVTTSTPISSDSDSESNPTTSQKRVGGSYIWDHGTKVLCENGSSAWRCGYCRKVLPCVSSTSNQRRHLREIHKMKDPGDNNPNDQQTTLDAHILRPFRVDVARKLLVEYHIES